MATELQELLRVAVEDRIVRRIAPIE